MHLSREVGRFENRQSLVAAGRLRSFGGRGAAMPEEPDEVIASIRTAFAGVPRSPVTIHETEVIDG